MNGSPRDATLFVDRNTGGRNFRNLVTAAGIYVELHDDHFPQGTKDHEWLHAVGERGWIVVTGDERTASSPIFLQELSRSAVHVFILRGLNSVTSEEKAKCLIQAFPKITALAAAGKPPDLHIFRRDGTLLPYDFRKRVSQFRQWGRIRD